MDGGTGLRAGASVLAAAAFVGSYGFVVTHPKNADAPLQPPAAQDVALRGPSPTPSTAPKATATPRGTPARGTPPPKITLQPGVRATELPGITYTHVS